MRAGRARTERRRHENGGTVLLHRSHVHHVGLSKRVDPDADSDAWEYFPVPPGDDIFSQCKKKVGVELSPGQMLLFDSRTVHRVRGPTDPLGTERVVAFVSMTPASFASKDTLRQRRQAFRLGIPTTHWPHRFVDRGDDRVVCGFSDPRLLLRASQLVDGRMCAAAVGA